MPRFITKRHLITLAIAALIPGVTAGIAEYIITKGVSGWIPPGAALIGGVPTMVVLWLMDGGERLGPPKLQDLRGPVPLTGDRIFSRRTPDELVDLVRGLTDVEAKRVVEPHIGQWLEVEGSVRDVQSLAMYPHEYMLVSAETSKDRLNVHLYFSADTWGPHLRSLRIGDRISAIGKIERVTSWSGSLSLRECELVG